MPVPVWVPTQRPLVPSFTSLVGGRELFTLPYAAADAHGAMGGDQKKLYHNRSVAVTPAPVRVPTCPEFHLG